MKFDSFRVSDIDPFLGIAAEEGWIFNRREMDFLINLFPQGCFAVRDIDGSSPDAFITSISYGRSGWVGNLIVKGDRRRSGTGSALMVKALKVLSETGVRTIWLTASEQGAPLYSRMGFKEIDRVHRWCIDRSLMPLNLNLDIVPEIERLGEFDRLGWGDDRFVLLHELVNNGLQMNHGGSCMVLQKYAGISQIGPWCGNMPEDAEKQLEILCEMPLAQGVTFLDVPEGNTHISSILAKKRFSKVGETILMWMGETPAYQNKFIYALATMGSIG